MSSSPSVTDTSHFTPKEITSPSKEPHGISKTVFTHISLLRKYLEDWLNMCSKGTKLCKTISAFKLYEYNNDYYPQQLQPLIDSLLEALDSLNSLIKGIEIINNQLRALSKLQSGMEPVILTWSVSQISEFVDKMFSTLVNEFKLKQAIAENIAHCRDEKLIEVYVSSWEYDVYFDVDSTSYLFVEVGLNGIT